MEFTCSVSEMTRALDTVSRALSSRPILKDYENIRVSADDGRVTLSCTDGTVYMTGCLPATVAESGDVCLEGRLLAETVKKQGGAELTVRADDKRATLTSGRSRMQLATRGVENFREPPQLKDEAQDVTLPAARLQGCIDFVQYAAGIDQTRRILTGILLQITTANLRAVALDGFRAALMDAECAYDGPDVKAIVPRDSAVELGKLLRGLGDGDVTLRTDGTFLMAAVDAVTFYTVLIPGEYISYEQIIPKDGKTVALVNAKELRGGLERAQIMAREGKRNLIRLSFRSDRLTITSDAPEGDFVEDVDCALQGEPMDIAFNCRYIMDAALNEDGEHLEISMTTSVQPALFRDPEKAKRLQIALPVRDIATAGRSA